MYITDLDFLATQERYKDMLREAEQERLIRAAGIRPGIAGGLYRVAADWLSAQIVRLGIREGQFSKAGPRAEISAYYKIDKNGIVETAKRMLSDHTS